MKKTIITAFLCATFISSPVFARPYLREYCHNINGRFLEDSHVRDFAVFVTESTLNILTTSARDPFFLNTKDPNFDSIYSIVRTAELVGTTIDFCFLPQDHSILGMSLNRMSGRRDLGDMCDAQGGGGDIVTLSSLKDQFEPHMEDGDEAERYAPPFLFWPLRATSSGDLNGTLLGGRVISSTPASSKRDGLTAMIIVVGALGPSFHAFGFVMPRGCRTGKIEYYRQDVVRQVIAHPAECNAIAGNDALKKPRLKIPALWAL